MRIDPTFHLITDNTEATRQYQHYRKAWELRPQQFYTGMFPMHVDLELNSHCNLRCVMCFQYDRSLPYQEMDLRTVKKIIEECGDKGCYAMKFNHRGEPLLATHLTEAVRLAKEAGILETMINTNATLLHSHKIQEVVDAGLDKIICSVDSYRKELYEEIRIGANFDTVMANICTLQTYKQLKDLEKPICRVQMVLMDTNKDDQEEYVTFWEEIADQVAIEECFDYGDREEYNSISDFVCPQLWQRLMVHVDGLVYPCCSLTAEPIGSIYKDDLETLWRCDKMEELRFLHKKGRSHEIEMCRRCYMRKKEVKRCQF